MSVIRKHRCIPRAASDEPGISVATSSLLNISLMNTNAVDVTCLHCLSGGFLRRYALESQSECDGGYCSSSVTGRLAITTAFTPSTSTVSLLDKVDDRSLHSVGGRSIVHLYSSTHVAYMFGNGAFIGMLVMYMFYGLSGLMKIQRPSNCST